MLLNDLSLDNKPTKTEEPEVELDLPKDVASLSDLDLDEELLAQYKRARRLLALAEHDEEVPLSQKATALNAISTIITNITKTQTELYNAERLKTLELVLVSVLKRFPEIKEQFLAEYAAALNREH